MKHAGFLLPRPKVGDIGSYILRVIAFAATLQVRLRFRTVMKVRSLIVLQFGRVLLQVYVLQFSEIYIVR